MKRCSIRSLCLLTVVSVAIVPDRHVVADEATPTQRKETGKSDPQPLKGLIEAVVALSEESLEVRNFNGIARAFSIPEHAEMDGPIICVNRTKHAMIVHSLRQQHRADVVMYQIRGETMYLFLTSLDGKLVRAIQRKKDKDFTTTPFTGDEAETMFREQVEFWQKWRAEREKKAEQEKAGKK